MVSSYTLQIITVTHRFRVVTRKHALLLRYIDFDLYNRVNGKTKSQSCQLYNDYALTLKIMSLSYDLSPKHSPLNLDNSTLLKNLSIFLPRKFQLR